MIPVKEVHHTQMESLVFRAQHAILSPFKYVVPFGEWVLAGISFNHRGCSMSDLAIKDFVFMRDLLGIEDKDFPDTAKTAGALVLQQDHNRINANLKKISKFINLYYEDMFNLMCEYLTAAHRKKSLDRYENRPRLNARRTTVAPSIDIHEDLCICPSFDDVPFLHSYFATAQVVLGGDSIPSTATRLDVIGHFTVASTASAMVDYKAILNIVSRNSNLFQMAQHYFNSFYYPTLTDRNAKLLEVSILE